jgi:uncharacterized protein (TIGR03545 family)
MTEKQFEKRVVSRIHQSREEQFIRSIFQKGEDGLLRLKEGVEPSQLKHLSRLAKALGKNTGIVTGWKAAILLVPAAGTVAFSAFYKDTLFEQWLEQALETVFEAKADVSDLEVSLLRGSFSFDHLSVADKESPMRNLFELGRTDVSVLPEELLKKKLIIEKISSRSILFNTERKVSGRLERPEGDAQASGPGPVDSVADALEPLAEAGKELAVSSGEALLAGYRENLSSPGLFEQAEEDISGLPDKWEKNIEGYSARLVSLKEDASKIITQDPAKLTSLKEIEAYAQSVSALKRNTEETIESIDGGIDSLESDLDRIDDYRTALEAAVQADLRYLRSAAGGFSSDAAQAVRQNAEAMLEKRFGTAAAAARKGIDYYRSITAEKKPADPGAERDRSGRVISFSGRGYPPFLLRTFLAEFGTRGETGYTLFSIEELTTSPADWDLPTLAHFETAGEGGNISSDILFEGGADTLLAQISLEMDQIPVRTEGIELLKMERLDGTGSVMLRASLDDTASGSASAEIIVDRLDYRFSPDGDLAARAAESVFDELESLNLASAFRLENGSIASVSVETDLDERIGSALMRFGKEEAERQTERLVAEYRESIAEEEESIKRYTAELRELEASLLGERKEAEGLEARLEARRKDAVDAVKSLAEKEGKKGLESLGKTLGF